MKRIYINPDSTSILENPQPAPTPAPSEKPSNAGITNEDFANYLGDTFGIDNEEEFDELDLCPNGPDDDDDDDFDADDDDELYPGDDLW